MLCVWYMWFFRCYFRDHAGISVFEFFIFFFKQKTAYEMRISDWSSDVCSSDLVASLVLIQGAGVAEAVPNPDGSRSSTRSEERRVGKECVSTCRSRWSPYH